jgi:hypothetical protein
VRVQIIIAEVTNDLRKISKFAILHTFIRHYYELSTTQHYTAFGKGKQKTRHGRGPPETERQKLRLTPNRSWHYEVRAAEL